jgi:hypothetical protein
MGARPVRRQVRPAAHSDALPGLMLESGETCAVARSSLERGIPGPWLTRGGRLRGVDNPTAARVPAPIVR